MKNTTLQIRRYNIYSCMTIKSAGLEICFDPAKIRTTDIDSINPDMIFISHESMDHMDPIQVYFLQKRKKCKIFCSIAAAADLSHYFSKDIDFVDSLFVLTPGCQTIEKAVQIQAAQSVHCDYMLPLVFSIRFIKNNLSILHCFDSHLSDEIIQISSGTDIAIIPIGIAKGISPTTGFDFVQKLHSKTFVTNHFKTTNELNEFQKLVEREKSITHLVPLDWNQSCKLNIPTIPNAANNNRSIDISTLENQYSMEYLRDLLVSLSNQRCKLLQERELVQKLYASFQHLDNEKKTVLLIIFSIICLIDPYLIEKNVMLDLQLNLASESSNQVNNLKTVTLFFLGIYAQQMSQTPFIDRIISMIDDPFDHVNYWIVEFLGRAATAKGGSNLVAIDGLFKIIQTPRLYTSVIVRRKIFWELYRIMKSIPHLSHRFFKVFEDGLGDSNPDVRLLALLCFGLANRIYPLTTEQLNKIFELFDDPEDDVRETAVKTVGLLMKHHKELVMCNRIKIINLLSDQNCHVKFAAHQTQQLMDL